jgi:hypothetical protein
MELTLKRHKSAAAMINNVCISGSYGDGCTSVMCELFLLIIPFNLMSHAGGKQNVRIYFSTPNTNACRYALT